MRITGGKARGIQLQSPSKGQTRPATDYLREAVFASLGGIAEGARVLDCFAGTGAYALEAMSRGAHSATLIEQNAAAVRCMRQNAAAVAKSAGFGVDRLDIRQADAVQAVKRLAGSLPVSAAPAGQAATDAVAATGRTGMDVVGPAGGTAADAVAAAAPAGNEGNAGTGYTLMFVDPPYAVWDGGAAALLAALAALLRASVAEDARLVLEAPGQWVPPELAGLRLVRHLKKGAHQPAALIYAKA